MAKVTVQAYERVLLYRDGAFERELEPGRHTVRRIWRVRREPVDPRLRQLAVAGQEIFTADGVPVRVTAVLRWQVADPRAFVERAEDPTELLHVALQLAVRDAVGRRELDELLRAEGRDAVTAELADPVRAEAAELGIAVQSAAVRDLVLVGELRTALGETALERQRGKAALERARGEAAALRSLANSAKLLDDHPALATLRLVQTAADSGATVVLTPDGLPPRR
ncbi:SPFH domain/Band 7 family protein [Kribbella amoyensis]|uniref:SPFH domain/Band 7 family protein n=1 Tax=Kribbella amoyensis TaxID=996641 RepID=A0A561BXM4_9ACTN|nr:slipin family protein [Kribbella amoyensis]TWD83640.1 SPFH domain/Band 7 family protein [Kribbella amoyensis]